MLRELGDIARFDKEFPSKPRRPLHRDACEELVDVPTLAVPPIGAEPIVAPIFEALGTLADVEPTRSDMLHDIFINGHEESRGHMWAPCRGPCQWGAAGASEP